MTQEQAIQQALAKAASNPSFRASLMNDAKGVLGREYPGITFSDDLQLNIELSDDDLEMVAGGWGDGEGSDGGDSGGDTGGGDTGGGDTGGDTGGGASGCFRGLGVGNDGTKGQGKGQGQNNGGGLGLQTQFKG